MMAAVARMAADFPPSPGLALKENHFRIGISKKEAFTFAMKAAFQVSEIQNEFFRTLSKGYVIENG